MNREPEYSCPFLDEAIDRADSAANEVRHAVEKARTIHDELRTWGREWEKEAKRFESLLADKTQECEELESACNDLRDEIKDRDATIERLERALAQAEAEIAEAAR